MLSLIISTIVFVIAAWFLSRYLDDMGIAKGMTRGTVVFVLASLVSWGAGSLVDWGQGKTEDPAAASKTQGDFSQLLKSVGQPQP